MKTFRHHDRPVRPAAVAGQFYPEDPQELREEVDSYIAQAQPPDLPAPKAIIAPHAGFMYSGPIAGTAYACLKRAKATVKRIILIGPSHFASFSGLAASSARFFETPLGELPIDQDALGVARDLPQVTVLDPPHHREHSLEVQLPFLQTIFADFTLVPLLVGDARPSQVGEVLNALWGGPETRLVVSSDLSHYEAYDAACRLDRDTARTIESLDEENLRSDQACGNRPIRGLLLSAKAHHLQCRNVDLRNSGDTAGRRDRVVGYGGFVFWEPAPAPAWLAPRAQLS